MKLLFLLLSFLASPVFAAERVVINPDSNGDLKIKVNVAGTPTDAITVTGSTGAVSIPTTLDRPGEDVVYAQDSGSTSFGPWSGAESVTAVMGTELIDLSSAYASNVYTAKKAGYYRVTWNAYFIKASGTCAAGDAIRVILQKNASGSFANTNVDASTVNYINPFSLTGIVLLAVNDTVRAKYEYNCAATRTYSGAIVAPFISISKL